MQHTAVFTTPMKPIGERIPIDHEKLAALRQSAGLSIEKVADASGMSANNYRALEAGERDPKLSQVAGLLRVFRLTWADLPKLLRREFRL